MRFIMGLSYLIGDAAKTVGGALVSTVETVGSVAVNTAKPVVSTSHRFLYSASSLSMRVTIACTDA